MGSRHHLPLVLLLALVVRVPFWHEAMRTPLDGDTSIIGLMALHPGQGTTMWGQPYGSPLEAWLALPLLKAMGVSAEPMRLLYFLLGLGLVPVAYFLAQALEPRAALPAAALLACPPPYFLLLSSLPPPLYPSTLILCGVLLALSLRVGDSLAAGDRPIRRLALLGALGGLALWTHLMSASIVAACALYLLAKKRRGPLLAVAAAALLLTSAPWWLREAQALRIVRVSDRGEGFADHLSEVLPAMPLPIASLLGTQVPLVADDAEAVVLAPAPVRAAIVLVYGVCLVLALRSAQGGSVLMLTSVALCLLAFPLPLRSGAHTVRFLTPLYLPLTAFLVAWAARAGGARRAWLLVLTLACLHLLGGLGLLAAWRRTERSAPPFLLTDLRPLRQLLDAHGIRHVYASYGPAYRLTFESAEKIVASQPWNERFLHYPLPYLDEVRFAKDVAWVLTPAIPSDLAAPAVFEDALASAGGSFVRDEAGQALVYRSFVPPYAPDVVAVSSLPSPSPTQPLLIPIDPPRELDGFSLVQDSVTSLPRSMDVEVSSDGSVFERVAQRRRRGEREDLRWLNGQPQYVIDHDFLCVRLDGRKVAAIRITPVASTDVWGLGDVLLHPHQAAQLRPWPEWLDPNLDWPARRDALLATPLRDREDWHYRLLLAQREH